MLKGEWHVVHYSNDPKYRGYVRIGTVVIEQKMDEYYLVKGKNSSVKNGNKVDHSDWYSYGAYKFSPGHRKFSGVFDCSEFVDHEAGKSKEDKSKEDKPKTVVGWHELRILGTSNQRMIGDFYNAHCDEERKPKEGKMKLFIDQEEAQQEYGQLLVRRNSSGEN
ncbi:MAG: hypothetical protein FWE62_01935 [Firmicutes bacterium]|nr:hypothetical protein [Bacillota bacterium]